MLPPATRNRTYRLTDFDSPTFPVLSRGLRDGVADPWNGRSESSGVRQRLFYALAAARPSGLVANRRLTGMLADI